MVSLRTGSISSVELDSKGQKLSCELTTRISRKPFIHCLEEISASIRAQHADEGTDHFLHSGRVERDELVTELLESIPRLPDSATNARRDGEEPVLLVIPDPQLPTGREILTQQSD